MKKIIPFLFISLLGFNFYNYLADHKKKITPGILEKFSFKNNIGNKVNKTSKNYLKDAIKRGYRNDIYIIKNDEIILKRDVMNRSIILGTLGMIRDRKNILEELKKSITPPPVE